MLFDKLQAADDRCREIERRMTLPEVAADRKTYTGLCREYAALSPLVTTYREYRAAEREQSEALALARDAGGDAELRAFAEETHKEAKEKTERLERQLRILLLPKDPNDEKNVIVEIRAGTGGEEAALFAADLYRMYCMYAQDAGFRVVPFFKNETGLGGFREVDFTVEGEGAYSKFKFESGVHRVQRVPVTDSGGRIQTSAVTVAVLPEVDAVEVKIQPQELRFESCKSSGAGGQHINKTESAVRLTHLPTGIVIECDEERSQLQNKEKAVRLLYSRLYAIREREQQESVSDARRSQVGSGDRSEKIRTYNFPQSRVTDHRINKTIYTLPAFLNGQIGEMIEELIAYDTAEKLKGEKE